MNFRAVVSQFALLMLVLSLIMLGIGGWAAIEWMLGDEREKAATIALLVSAVVGQLGGMAGWFTTRGSGQIGRREALLLVAISWLLGAALGALPFFLWAELHDTHHAFADPVNCYFEAMSGFTTTGATILTDIDTVPRSLLLWRAMTQWLGGLGIVVLFVAVLPSLGAGGKRLFKIESSSHSSDGVTPQVSETARVLWMIYLGLTLVQIAALWLAGVPMFEAVCHTFATLATGGFSTHNASIAAYHSVAVDAITIIFMFLAGANFALYFQIARGRVNVLWRDTEFKVYVCLMAVAAVLVIGSLLNQGIYTTAGEQLTPAVGASVRHGLFQTVSIQTTTGFGTADFDRWPFLAKAVLIAVMFIGGSAGSTAGGIKVVRLWIALKTLAIEVEKAFRPNVVRPLKIGNNYIDPDQRTGTLAFVLSMILIAQLGAALIMLSQQWFGDPTDYVTAATAAIATLFNIGPGLGAVGSTQTYHFFDAPAKLIMSLLMALGRLELFAILILFTPRFWRSA